MTPVHPHQPEHANNQQRQGRRFWFWDGIEVGRVWIERIQAANYVRTAHNPRIGWTPARQVSAREDVPQTKDRTETSCADLCEFCW